MWPTWASPTLGLSASVDAWLLALGRLELVSFLFGVFVIKILRGVIMSGTKPSVHPSVRLVDHDEGSKDEQKMATRRHLYLKPSPARFVICSGHRETSDSAGIRSRLRTVRMRTSINKKKLNSVTSGLLFACFSPFELVCRRIGGNR